MTRSQLLKTRLNRFTRALRGVETGDMRALHRARVSTRRLRALLPVLQLDAETSRKLNRRLRGITNRLGAVRELDVLHLLIDELHVSRRGRGPALGRVGLVVGRARQAARKQLAENLPMEQMRKVSRKLGKVLRDLVDAEQNPPRRSASSPGTGWAVEARVAVRASRLKTAIDAAGAVYLPERLHLVRIALKKLRYALELDPSAASGDTRADLLALGRAQTVLGRMHDLQTLIDRVRGVQASIAPPHVSAWAELDALLLSLDADCRRLHARYMRQRDRLIDVAARLGARGRASARAGRRALPAPTRRAS
jgi:CHAD domain-containing protein